MQFFNAKQLFSITTIIKNAHDHMLGIIFFRILLCRLPKVGAVPLPQSALLQACCSNAEYCSRVLCIYECVTVAHKENGKSQQAFLQNHFW